MTKEDIMYVKESICTPIEEQMKDLKQKLELAPKGSPERAMYTDILIGYNRAESIVLKFTVDELIKLF